MKNNSKVAVIWICLFLITTIFIVVETENAKAGTPVSGHVYNDTVWTLANSPYWVVGNVVVESGVTLTIEPGVEVRFNVDCGLHVNGDLDAIGNNNNIIKFTSNKTLPSRGDWTGIRIEATGHGDIEFCDVTYGSDGIHISSSANNIIANCDVLFNSWRGIHLTYSASYNIIANCNVSSNGDNGIYLESLSNNNSITNCIVSENNDGIEFDTTLDNTIDNCDVFNNDDGIEINSSSNITVTNTRSSSNNRNGMYIFSLLNGCIKNCEMTSNINRTGIWLSSSQNNNIMNCTILNNRIGFTLESSSNNEISGCNVSYSKEGDGIYMYRSSNNIVTNCEFSYNKNYGIELPASSNNNLIHHNKFVSNTDQAYDRDINYWDDGSEGNYWSDYIGTDEDNNGIGDTPYTIPGGDNRDHYPLITPSTTVMTPIVTSISPNDDEKDVRVDTIITILFSKPMKRITVQNAVTISGGLIPTFFWSDNNRTATMLPPSNLIYDTQYTVTIDGTVAEDVVGNKLDGDKDGVGGDDYSWSFRTEAKSITSNEFLAGYWWLIFFLVVIIVMVIAIAFVIKKKNIKEAEGKEKKLKKGQRKKVKTKKKGRDRKTN